MKKRLLSAWKVSIKAESNNRVIMRKLRSNKVSNNLIKKDKILIRWYLCCIYICLNEISFPAIIDALGERII